MKPLHSIHAALLELDSLNKRRDEAIDSVYWAHNEEEDGSENCQCLQFWREECIICGSADANVANLRKKGVSSSISAQTTDRSIISGDSICQW
jgi:hypothetical protein